MAPKLPPPAKTKAVVAGVAWWDTDKVWLCSDYRHAGERPCAVALYTSREPASAIRGVLPFSDSAWRKADSGGHQWGSGHGRTGAACHFPDYRRRQAVSAWWAGPLRNSSIAGRLVV